MMLRYDQLLAVEKAAAAEQVMSNVIFEYIMSNELNERRKVAIHGPNIVDRENSRIAVITLEELLEEFRRHVRMREQDG